MRVGIPEYRMPYDLVQKEVDEIVSRGLELKLNSRVDDAAGLLGEYNAVFVATGAHVGLKTGIPGNDLPDVHVATDFLRAVSLRDMDGNPTDVKGKRVLVLGGGNVAVDSAMSSVRLGASWVGMTCLEGEGKMLAHDWEVRDCRDEGIDVMPGRNFLEITNKDGKVTGVRTVNVNFRGFVDGKIDMDVIPGTETVVPCDIVIYAISQRPDNTLLKDKFETARNRITVDKNTLATSVPGVFAGGDTVTGTTWVVDAIDAGHRAARAIEAFLKEEATKAWPPVVPVLERLPEAAIDPEEKERLLEIYSPVSRFEPRSATPPSASTTSRKWKPLSAKRT